MADSLRAPWICDYLITTGQTYGAYLSSVSFHKKPKKVQLVEFLTYQQLSQDDCIWAKVSDKWCTIPVRFTKQALGEYNNFVGQEGKRLTEHRNAIVQIKDFRVVFTRVPLGNDAKGMTKDARLALDVDFVKYVGSDAEATWGDPVDVGQNEQVKRWTEGLRQDGGAGNVLKLEKEQEESAKDKSDIPTTELYQKPSIRSSLRATGQVAKKTDRSRILSTPISAKKKSDNPVEADELRKWRKKWKPYLLELRDAEGEKWWLYANPPDNVQEQLREISDEEREQVNDSPEQEQVIDIPEQGQIIDTVNQEQGVDTLEQEQLTDAPEQEAPVLAASVHNVVSPRRSSSYKRRHVLELSSSPVPVEAEVESDNHDDAPPRQTTPSRSEWSPSVFGSQKIPKEDETVSKPEIYWDQNSRVSDRLPSPEEPNEDVTFAPFDVAGSRDAGPTGYTLPSSVFMGPTPAQRRRASTIPPSTNTFNQVQNTKSVAGPSLALASQDLTLSKPTILSPNYDYKPLTPQSSSQLPYSSLPAVSQQVGQTSTSISSPSIAMPLSSRKNVARKVPYPVQPIAPDPDASGPVRILVPNSDISGSASQGLSQSQTDSQTQSQSQKSLLSQNRILADLEEEGHERAPLESLSERHNPDELHNEPVHTGDDSYDADRSSPDRPPNFEVEVEDQQVQVPREKLSQTIVEGPTKDVTLNNSTHMREPQEKHESVNRADFDEAVVVDLPYRGHSEGSLSSDDEQVRSTLEQGMNKQATYIARERHRPSLEHLSSSFISNRPSSPPTSLISSQSRARVKLKNPPGFASVQVRSDPPVIPLSPDVFMDTSEASRSLGEGSSPTEASRKAIDTINVRVERVVSKSDVSRGQWESARALLQSLKHDAVAWSAPTFMQEADKAKALSPMQGGLKRKRTSGRSSDDKSEPTSKMSKVSHYAEHIPPSRPLVTSAVEAKTQRVRTVQRPLAVTKNAQPRGGVNHVGSDRALMDTKRKLVNEKRSSEASDKQSLREAGAAGSGSSTSDHSVRHRPARPKGQKDVIPMMKVAALPRRTTTSRWELGDSLPRRVKQEDVDIVPADSTTTEPLQRKEKLAGFRVNFDMKREENGPPLVSWEALTGILLRTGRIRTLQNAR